MLDVKDKIKGFDEVCLTGPKGCGKSYYSRFIHDVT